MNDSKGTNAGAVIKSLDELSGNVILLAGGVEKGGDYGVLRGPVEREREAPRALRRGARPAGRGRSRARPRSRSSTTLAAAVARRGRAGDEPATSCCCRRRARASTCFATTPTAAGNSKPWCRRHDDGARGDAFRLRSSRAGSSRARQAAAVIVAHGGDRWIVATVAALVTVGVVMVFNTSYFFAGERFGDPLHVFRSTWCRSGSASWCAVTAARDPLDDVRAARVPGARGRRRSC